MSVLPQPIIYKSHSKFILYLLPTGVCVCACVFTCIHLEGFICLHYIWCWETYQRCCVEDVLLSANSLHCYFITKHWTLQLACLCCSRNMQSHNLSNVRFAFKSGSIPLSDIAHAPGYIVRRSTSGVTDLTKKA